MFYSLSRRSHHKSAAGLIADGFQISETFPPVSKIHFRRVQTFVVIPVRSFVAQKISVRTGLKQFFVACPASFSDGKGERAVRVLFFSGAEYRNQLFISPVRIFAALQYKGAKAQTVAFFAAAKNFFRSQPVAFCICAAFADTAVIAVVFTVVGKLDQSADVNPISENLLADSICLTKEISIFFFSRAEQEFFQTVF